VAEGDFDDLLRCCGERVEYTVDVGRVDLRMIGRCEHTLLSLVTASLITHAITAAAAAAAGTTSPAVHDAMTCCAHHNTRTP